MSFPDYVEKWAKLDDDHPLAQLHSKFLGTNMQEEEEAWRAKERLTPAPCQCDKNRKPNENSGNGTDESEDEDEDTVLPGCYVLDINNDGIDLKSIWVRVSVFILGKMSSVFTNTIGRIHPHLGLLSRTLQRANKPWRSSAIGCHHWTTWDW